MAMQQNAHGIEMEKLAIHANIRAQQQQLDIASRQVSGTRWSDVIGQLFGWSISVGAVAGGIYLAMHNHEWAAVGFFSLPVAGVIRALRESGKK